SNSSGGPGCDGGPCNSGPPGPLDPNSTTAWNPGIAVDTPVGTSIGSDGLPARTTICAPVPSQSGGATSAIPEAFDDRRGKTQVVLLAVGRYTVSSTINIPSGVVLRGAGSDPASGTTIVGSSQGAVLSIGTMKDTVCYDSGFDSTAQPLLAQDAMKESGT